MGSVRKLPTTGKLFLDFRDGKRRRREYTNLDDTTANRKKLEKLLERIEGEIRLGTFDYSKFFPGSRMAAKCVSGPDTMPRLSVSNVQAAMAPAFSADSAANVTGAPGMAQGLPSFEEFAATWVAESQVTWRRSNRTTVNDILNKHLLPVFRDKSVATITKAEVLSFRSALAKLPGRKSETLSAKRINAIMSVLRQILNEAADRFEFNTAYRNIKQLKQQQPDVEPFTLDQVQLILRNVRKGYQPYYVVRFFTGMRTSEIDGLQWKYVDFDRRQILIRETLVAGKLDITKTPGSVREIDMSEVVFDALQEQAKLTRNMSGFVFCNHEGNPFDHNNVTKRIWYPLLRYLGLKARRPYQTRHTAATLWLASGENPLWISRQLGHSSTEMLFKVYGRFVPNLTRQDGSAFERLLRQSGAYAAPTSPEPTASAAPMAATATQENQHE